MTDSEIREDLRARGLLDIARSVADDHHVTLDELLGRERTAHVSAARYVWWALLHRRGLSYPKIGKLVGRDHTTVMYGVKRARSRPVEVHGFGDARCA